MKTVEKASYKKVDQNYDKALAKQWIRKKAGVWC